MQENAINEWPHTAVEQFLESQHGKNMTTRGTQLKAHSVFVSFDFVILTFQSCCLSQMSESTELDEFPCF